MLHDRQPSSVNVLSVLTILSPFLFDIFKIDTCQAEKILYNKTIIHYRSRQMSGVAITETIVWIVIGY